MHLTAYLRYALQFVGVLISLLCHAAVAQVCATPGNDAATTAVAGIVNTYYPGTGLLNPAGVALPALPALGSISFVLTCDVTATGQ